MNGTADGLLIKRLRVVDRPFYAGWVRLFPVFQAVGQFVSCGIKHCSPCLSIHLNDHRHSS
ncbi:uncharacterized protein PHALS_14968 [Plasmopara halstedii]|uniref:Uncharacterized protein n=1 Tax=Plasmopara halstedii TaxID=4781 RepID=A0A0N7L7I2_PLAHL|nr:uncharacterized protein PHALS_14968 [Plasmopara halstedii]CEG47147.1 hypothetical protein PHALS_14968 [Plasmopara halstedii]|eukprot:XP_024583516.1 hypothetical protein PHALS_14968 [Plasmopara halstedii]